MRRYHFTDEASTRLVCRHLSREAVHDLLQDQSAQIVKGNQPNTFVHQRVNSNARSLLRVVVARPRQPGDPWSICTVYYTIQVDRYWNRYTIYDIMSSRRCAKPVCAAFKSFRLLVCHADCVCAAFSLKKRQESSQALLPLTSNRCLASQRDRNQNDVAKTEW